MQPLLPALLLCPLVQASTAAGPTDSEFLEKVTAVHARQRNVGLAVAIHVDGEPVYAVQLGKADLDHGVDVGPETRFGIASVTKLFTATTMLLLEEDGWLDPDARVQEYVPDFPVKPAGEITVRMLASHRAGIPHPNDRTPKLFATRYDTATDAIEVFADEELLFTPGADQRYSSSNYNLLAAAIEGATGKLFTAVVRERVLEPLGLEHTSFDNVLRPLAHRARRYSFFHPWTYAESDELYAVPVWDYSFNVGGGNMVSTADDLARFGQALLEPGLLPAASYERLVELFGETDAEGRATIFASGSNPGVQVGLSIHPAERVSVAVLSNTWGVGARSGEMVYLANVLAAMFVDGDGPDDG